MRSRLKICGISTRDDLAMVSQSGADYAGVLVEIDSPRAVSMDEARIMFKTPKASMVAVVMDRSVDDCIRIAMELQPTALQLHGDESVADVSAIVHGVTCEVWKVIHAPAAESGTSVNVEQMIAAASTYVDAGVTKLLIDASVQSSEGEQRGGTGKTVDWSMARQVRDAVSVPVVLAGGINPTNVIKAIEMVEPFAVDCSSGVESHRCKKDPVLVSTMVDRSRVTVKPESESYE